MVLKGYFTEGQRGSPSATKKNSRPESRRGVPSLLSDFAYFSLSYPMSTFCAAVRLKLLMLMIPAAPSASYLEEGLADFNIVDGGCSNLTQRVRSL